MEFRLRRSKTSLLRCGQLYGYQIESFFGASIVATSLGQGDEHLRSRCCLGNHGIGYTFTHFGDSFVASPRSSHSPAPEKSSHGYIERDPVLDGQREHFVGSFRRHPRIAEKEMAHAITE